MGKKEVAMKIADIDKRYFKLRYVLLTGIIIGVVLFVLSLIFPSTKDYIEISKRYFRYLIIPLLQLFIIGLCGYFLMKGGYNTVITKDVKDIGKEAVEHTLKQSWLFSIFVPGSGQLLLGHTKRGVILFLITLFLESYILILIKRNAMLTLLLVVSSILIIFWIWNLKDAYKIASQAKIV